MFHTHPNFTSPLHLVELKETLWEKLLDTMEKIDPKRIAVNVGLFVWGYTLSPCRSNRYVIFDVLWIS